MKLFKYSEYNESKKLLSYKYDEIPFAISHHLGNPIDATDSLINLAIKFIEKGEIEKALECLKDANISIEDAKSILNDFKTGNINFK